MEPQKTKGLKIFDRFTTPRITVKDSLNCLIRGQSLHGMECWTKSDFSIDDIVRRTPQFTKNFSGGFLESESNINLKFNLNNKMAKGKIFIYFLMLVLLTRTSFSGHLLSCISIIITHYNYKFPLDHLKAARLYSCLVKCGCLRLLSPVLCSESSYLACLTS